MSFHIAVGVALLGTAWWWNQGVEVATPPQIAVSLPSAIPNLSPIAAEVTVVPPEEIAPSVIPVIEVEATALPPLEELPEESDYRAVRPWMPRRLRYRPTTTPPKSQLPRVVTLERTAPSAPLTTPVIPPASGPISETAPNDVYASVLLAPQIDSKQCPAPTYPRRARRLRWQGVAQLLVQVDAAGTPKHILVQESSGHDLLDQAAMEAVMQWRFHPARRDGVAEAGELLVPIRFQIKN